jgi:uncharacterized protein YlaI
MNRDEYSKLLTAEEWQEKRLRILNRSGWLCEECHERPAENVHHRCYVGGRKPWQYTDFELQALCRWCHMHKHLRQLSEREKYELQVRIRIERTKYFKKMGWASARPLNVFLASPLFGVALVLVRFHHVACLIVNANHGIM